MEVSPRCMIIDLPDTISSPSQVRKCLDNVAASIKEIFVIESKQQMIIEFLDESTDHQDLLSELSNQSMIVHQHHGLLRHIAVQIYGMTCESCPEHLNKVIQQMEEVYYAKFTLADQMGHIVYNSHLLTIGDILNAIDECGFEARFLNQQMKDNSLGKLNMNANSKKRVEMVIQDNKSNKLISHDDPIAQRQAERKKEFKKVQLYIEGMSCASCVAKIENQVNKLDGVHSTAVTLLSKKGVVEFDETKITNVEIAKQVEKLGFDVEVKEIFDNYQYAELQVFYM
ncbi:Copper-transporting ATPase 2 [Trichoplax sp. H2]|nr:Copper-transporting ATPase 2 [Trichoplax sp. H2]|eukprot:RDD35817.1 Copper-transporting ATPase 2 [Trichoplax sp. H2]